MSQDTIWRCHICASAYLGSVCPSNCPFCGSRSEYITLSSEYPEDVNDVEITEAERADLEAACQLEITNLTFYKELGEVGDRDDLLPNAFRALARVEEEHLSDFSKLLKTPAPTKPDNPLTVKDSWVANIEQSHVDEVKASTFYQEAAARATTPRVKQIFTALSEVEADHIAIDDYMKAFAQANKL